MESKGNKTGQNRNPEQMEQQRELTELLNKAAYAYYQKSEEIMSNYEYDALYDKLVELEKETGVVLSNSPTVRVGYEVLSELPKEQHANPMLSLDKTKDREALKSFLGDKEGILSWKLDGLTIVLTYEGGQLKKAVTRGNGEVGEVITNNAKVFRNIPLAISYQEEVTIRGEAVIRYSDFEAINAGIGEEDAKYKNPRNLCSGTVRQLNNEITAARPVYFYAFTLVSADMEFETKHEQMEWLTGMGFDVVEQKMVTKDNILETVEWFSNEVSKNDLPSDGLVLTFDNIAYGRSLGRTAKFPKDSIAFKWQDEIRETTLKDIEWSASRTGLINPVAIFEPVELEGTSVSRASVHNVSIVESLALGIGDTITVYKANMIIPQIAKNLTRSGNLELPKNCPVCGEPVKVLKENDVKVLFCGNMQCQAKKIKSFALFVSRDAINIDGLSEATLEKMIQMGFVKDYLDLFYLERYHDEIVAMEGFGEKSFQRLLHSVEAARKTTPARLIYSLGIDNIGLSTAKLICKNCDNSLEKVISLSKEELLTIDGIGDVIADSFVHFFADDKQREQVLLLAKELDFEEESVVANQEIEGKVFVITGSVNHFSNRNEVKELIESMGGKVTGSVTKNTDYLINNDVTSSSSKNKKAKELGVLIISEEDFMKLAGIEL